jgi:hypothetical protein
MVLYFIYIFLFTNYYDFCSDIHEMTWKHFNLPAEVISFFTKCVNTIPEKLTLTQWGIIEICVASWNLSIKKSIDYIEDFKVKIKTFIICVQYLRGFFT